MTINKKLSRKEKEDLCRKEMINLQRHWGNPTNEYTESDLNFSDWTDEQLEKSIKDSVGQIKFERIASLIGKITIFLIISFVALGIIGLLIFGIRQLF